MTAPARPRCWVLVYTRAGERLPWLRVVDVPADLKRGDVMGALETWRRWPAYAPGPNGRLSLVPLERAGEVVAPLESAHAIEWAELAPETVRTTLELEGGLHARVVMAARRRGVSQAAWMVEAIASTLAERNGG